MGNYNMQYQSYYNNLARKQKKSKNFGSQNNRQSSESNFYLKRLTRELVGVLVLFIFVIFCKVIVTTQTQQVYNYSKKVINKEYDYKVIVEKLKGIKLEDIEASTIAVIDKIKSTLFNGDTINDKIRKNFISPVSQENFSDNIINGIMDKDTNSIMIKTPINTEVLASYDGRVKECGEDKSLGKFILIDHGDGVETMYGNLNELLVRREDPVKKQQVIAKSGNKGKYEIPSLYFKLSSMGGNIQVNELIQFSEESKSISYKAHSNNFSNVYLPKR